MAEFPHDTKKEECCKNCYHRARIGAGPFCNYHAGMQIELSQVCDHWRDEKHPYSK